MDDFSEVPELIPARMVNAYEFCPRLCYLEWIQKEFEGNEYTDDGKFVHRRVDTEGTDSLLPDPDDKDAPKAVRSALMSAPKAGFIAKVDLLEIDGVKATPVEYKRGAVPDVDEGAHSPELVQIGVQAVILRENGYECDRAYVYYAGSRQRVVVAITDALVDYVLALGAEMRRFGKLGMPAPLEDSPKCTGCSLAPICLPDETRALMDGGQDLAAPLRLLAPPRDDAAPGYVQEQGAFVGKRGDRLEVKRDGEKIASFKLFELSHLALFGRIQISTDAVRELCQRSIPIAYFSTGGWFLGYTLGTFNKNVEGRIAQFRHAGDTELSLQVARAFVAAKIKNSRTLLRRNGKNLDASVLVELKRLITAVGQVSSLDSLLGIEGQAAKLYFSGFETMLRAANPDFDWHLDGRNRRPPRDPVNALLSLAYALLAKDATISLMLAGLDPFCGFLHRPRYGRPSLALDLMEEFRPLIADSVVITAINKKVVTGRDFVTTREAAALKPSGRRAFLECYEQRMADLVVHPLFGYRLSYRRVMAMQARVLARYLLGDVPSYQGFTTR